MQDTVDLLERYRTEYADVVTSRLHCYLPTISVGLRVTFEPKNNADVRFNGLFQLDPGQFEGIRTSMRNRLRPVLEAIFSGHTPHEVYALWRDLVSSEVALAQARHRRPAIPNLVGARLTAARVLVRSSPRSDAVDVILAPTNAERPYLRGVLTSAATHTSSPLRAWVVGRFGATPPEFDVPGVELHWIDTTDLAASIPVLADARAALPELVPVDRAILLPVDALVLGDVADLSHLDLGPTTVAARTSSIDGASGFAVLCSATRQLDDSPDTAFEFYRLIHQCHVFDFDAYGTGVLVLDLTGLRAKGAAAMRATIHTYHVDERAALCWYLGLDRADLGAAWAYVPICEWVREPRLVHWADATKPWSQKPRRAPGALARRRRHHPVSARPPDRSKE